MGFFKFGGELLLISFLYFLTYLVSRTCLYLHDQLKAILFFFFFFFLVSIASGMSKGIYFPKTGFSGHPCHISLLRFTKNLASMAHVCMFM